MKFFTERVESSSFWQLRSGPQPASLLNFLFGVSSSQRTFWGNQSNTIIEEMLASYHSHQNAKGQRISISYLWKTNSMKKKYQD